MLKELPILLFIIAYSLQIEEDCQKSQEETKQSQNLIKGMLDKKLNQNWDKDFLLEVDSCLIDQKTILKNVAAIQMQEKGHSDFEPLQEILDQFFKLFNKRFPTFGFSLRLKLPRIIKNNQNNIHDIFTELLEKLEDKIIEQRYIEAKNIDLKSLNDSYKLGQAIWTLAE